MDFVLRAGGHQRTQALGDADLRQVRHLVEDREGPQQDDRDEHQDDQPEGRPLDPVVQRVAPQHRRDTQDEADDGAAVVRADGAVDDDGHGDDDQREQSEGLPRVITEPVAEVLVPGELVARPGGEADRDDEADRATKHDSSKGMGVF